MNDDFDRMRPGREHPVAGRRQDDEDWATTDKRLTFGYVGPDGKWVPGMLEQIRNLAEEAKDAKNVDHWILRALIVIAVVRFLGVESLSALLRLFGVHI